MKTLAISCFLFSALLYGQAHDPVKATPGAPVLSPPGFKPPAPLPPDTVVLEVNGKKYTAAEVDKLIEMLPPQYQQAAHAQPRLLSQVFMMQRLADDAQKAGLDQKSPYKEQLEISRMQMLSTAELSDVNNTMNVSEADEQKYYNEHPDLFKQVKVRVIYIAFNARKGPAPASGKKSMTEAEAQAKIEDLAKQIKAGADFGKLARENSDDQASASKDGDFGLISQESAYPPAIKTAVFALKQGEVSAPIKEPGGFYLIRADEIHEKSFADSLIPVSQGARREKFQAWLKQLQSQYEVKIENQAYFAPRMPAPVQPAH